MKMRTLCFVKLMLLLSVTSANAAVVSKLAEFTASTQSDVTHLNSLYQNVAQNNNREFFITKEDIVLVQQALNKLGYNVGTADGIAHNRTVNAIVELQTAEGLAVTGEIDQQLLEFLEIR